MESRRYSAVVVAPIDLIEKIGIVIEDGALVGLDILSALQPDIAPKSQLAERVCGELLAYFDNPNHSFSLPLAPQGTPFQQRVWRQLQMIPVGGYLHYGELARRIESGARAVGGACRANPIPLIIPCHRVTAQNGLGGYSGEVEGRELALKAWLLRHEGVHL